MQIILNENLRNTHYGRITCHREMAAKEEWYVILDAVSGKTLEVETDHLFQDQFNTAPIPGISPPGIRAMAWMVKEVINDARIGMMRCGWCGKCEKSDVACSKCGNNGVSAEHGGAPLRHFIALSEYHKASITKGTGWEYSILAQTDKEHT